MHQLAFARRRIVYCLLSTFLVAGLIGVSGVGVASAAPQRTTTAPSMLQIRAGHATLVATSTGERTDTARLLASWNAKLPRLKQALASGESYPAALRQAGLPALTGKVVSSAPKAGVQPFGPSCQSYTCGWEFSPLTTFEIEWLVWASTTAGPGAMCALLGPETLGWACVAAAALWAILGAYFYAPPSMNWHKCLYIGEGWGTVAKFDRC